MGRKRSNAVHSLFSYDKVTNFSTCLVTGCSAKIKGQHATNLLYHLSSRHENEFKIIQKRNESINNDECRIIQRRKKSIRNEECTQNEQYIANTSEDNTADNHVSNEFDELRNECINLVIVHGRPFAVLDDDAFKNILILTKLPQRELESVNSHSIRELIKSGAIEKRNEIALELKDKLICIKVDNTMYQDRMFLGVNAQYIDDRQIHIRFLGVTELHTRSKSDLLRENVLCIIRKYNLTVDQIYSVTTDNGSNLLTTTLRESLSLYESDLEDEEGLSLSHDFDISLAESHAADHYSISSIRCVAQTLQLAINDSLLEDKAFHTIESARTIVRRLRTPTMKKFIAAVYKLRPIIDCTTLWHSTVNMLERLLELRDCCSTTPSDNLYMSESCWQNIQNLITALTPAKTLAKELLSEQLTIGDFYYFWTKCHFETAKINIPFAQSICKHMEMRQQQLMQNNTFVSGIFLDPRFQVVLSAEQMATAIHHIHMVWMRLLKVQGRGTETDLEPSAVIKLEQTDDEIELILAQTEQNRRQGQQDSYFQSESYIVSLLENFSRHPRLNSKENILKFWSEKGLSDPQLCQLACIILATPVTQVSVERLFSALKFVLSSLRYNLSDEIVEDILVLKYN